MSEAPSKNPDTVRVQCPHLQEPNVLGVGHQPVSDSGVQEDPPVADGVD